MKFFANRVEIYGMKTALFTGGDRRPGRLYKVPVSRAHSRPSERLFISEEAVKNSPDILGMTWRNLVHRAEPSSPPFVFVRDPAHARAYKLFLGQREIARLAAFFGFSAAVASGGIFSLLNYRFYKSESLSLAPRWEELTDPIWRKAFLDWIARKGRIPEMSEIDPWTLFSSTKITMPGMADASLIHNAYERETGRLVLFEHDGDRRALFDRGDVRQTVYSLSLDVATGKDRIEFLGFTRPSVREDFDRTSLAALFGPKPSSTIYLCSKRAISKKEIGLGNIGGLRFVIESGSVSYKKGKLYFLRLERAGSSLNIECFEDEAHQRLLGHTNVDLLEGFPAESIVTLLPAAAPAPTASTPATATSSAAAAARRTAGERA